MTNTTPTAQSTISSAVQPFRVRTSCGHIVTRHMRAETARVGGGTGDPAVDIIEAPGGLACISCRARRAHVPLCSSGCDNCAGARSAALTGEGRIVSAPNGWAMWEAPAEIAVGDTVTWDAHNGCDPHPRMVVGTVTGFGSSYGSVIAYIDTNGARAVVQTARLAVVSEPSKPAPAAPASKPTAPAPAAFVVRRVSLDGAVYTSDPRSEANARAWAAVVLRDDPSAAVSIVPVVPGAPPPAPTRFRVTRRGPGSERKEYGPFEARELADHVALRAVEKHPGATVSVLPLRSAS